MLLDPPLTADSGIDDGPCRDHTGRGGESTVFRVDVSRFFLGGFDIV